jgi:hypothetical protein
MEQSARADRRLGSLASSRVACGGEADAYNLINGASCRCHLTHRSRRDVSSLKDAVVRRRVTQAREEWRKEVLWMRLYFSAGVWVSLGIIFV